MSVGVFICEALQLHGGKIDLIESDAAGRDHSAAVYAADDEVVMIEERGEHLGADIARRAFCAFFKDSLHAFRELAELFVVADAEQLAGFSTAGYVEDGRPRKAFVSKKNIAGRAGGLAVAGAGGVAAECGDCYISYGDAAEIAVRVVSDIYRCQSRPRFCYFYGTIGD